MGEEFCSFFFLRESDFKTQKIDGTTAWVLFLLDVQGSLEDGQREWIFCHWQMWDLHTACGTKKGDFEGGLWGERHTPFVFHPCVLLVIFLLGFFLGVLFGIVFDLYFLLCILLLLYLFSLFLWERYLFFVLDLPDGRSFFFEKNFSDPLLSLFYNPSFFLFLSFGMEGGRRGSRARPQSMMATSSVLSVCTKRTICVSFMADKCLSFLTLSFLLFLPSLVLCRKS